ncbi:unnamed protein product, partial [Choristocarpus tenellus]
MSLCGPCFLPSGPRMDKYAKSGGGAHLEPAAYALLSIGAGSAVEESSLGVGGVNISTINSDCGWEGGSAAGDDTLPPMFAQPRLRSVASLMLSEDDHDAAEGGGGVVLPESGPGLGD